MVLFPGSGPDEQCVLLNVVDYKLDGRKVTMITLLAATLKKTCNVPLWTQNSYSRVSNLIEEPIIPAPGGI